ncbi:MAG TPA: hypothetical protein VH498_09165 [Candidatus Dormibacteraeota bacterium]|nr:hypothetical protein [Candidatus Dormibacteraeota bacterium]
MSRRRKPQSRRQQPRKPAAQAVAQPAPQPTAKPSTAQTQGARRVTAPRRRGAPARRPSRWRLWPLSGAGFGLLTVVVVGAGVAIAFALHGGGSATTPPPFGTPLGSPAPTPAVLAPPSASVVGQPIDGIQCLGNEQLVFHIHAHLAVYVGGSPRTVPEGIGITPPRQESEVNGAPYVTGGSCFYWLHSHTADGIIHIESPVQRTFTLGNWFDIWGIALDATHVGPATGTVVAYLDGQVYSGDLRSIPLGVHTLIQLDVNGNVPAAPFTFPPGL